MGNINENQCSMTSEEFKIFVSQKLDEYDRKLSEILDITDPEERKIQMALLIKTHNDEIGAIKIEDNFDFSTIDLNDEYKRIINIVFNKQDLTKTGYVFTTHFDCEDDFMDVAIKLEMRTKESAGSSYILYGWNDETKSILRYLECDGLLKIFTDVKAYKRTKNGLKLN